MHLCKDTRNLRFFSHITTSKDRTTRVYELTKAAHLHITRIHALLKCAHAITTSVRIIVTLEAAAIQQDHDDGAVSSLSQGLNNVLLHVNVGVVRAAQLRLPLHLTALTSKVEHHLQMAKVASSHRILRANVASDMC